MPPVGVGGKVLERAGQSERRRYRFSVVAARQCAIGQAMRDRLVPDGDIYRHVLRSSRIIGARKSGSSGLAVGTNLGLPHQENLEEFFPFFGQTHRSWLSVHGFVTR